MFTNPTPKYIVAGDSVSFVVGYTDWPAPDWSMKYVIGTPEPTIVDATVQGLEHLVTLTTEISNQIAPGIYSSHNVYLKPATSERVSRANPFLLVLPNPLVAQAASWAQTTLEAVQVAIAKIGSSANTSVSINGQTFTKANVNMLWEMRDRLIAEIGRENALAGKPTRGGSRTIKTRFRY